LIATLRADRRAYVVAAFRLNASDPNRPPPLKSEAHGLIDSSKPLSFGHAEVTFLLAQGDARVVGRNSAQVDQLAHARQNLEHFPIEFTHSLRV
jgi:hypothetical protein